MNKYLSRNEDHARKLALEQDILVHLEKYSTKILQGLLGFDFIGVMDGIAQTQLSLKQLEKAEQSYLKVLRFIKNFNVNKNVRGSIRKIKGGIYHNLGIVAEEQHKYQIAKQYYQKALAAFIKINDEHSQANSYQAIGRILQIQRQWKLAEKKCQKALAIYIKFNDEYEQARAYSHLGVIASKQRQLIVAEQYYQKTLATFIKFNDKHGQAQIYYNLGIIAREQYQWLASEQYYQNALAIFIELNDKYSQATPYHNLGTIAQEQKQWQQAKDYYLKALSLYSEFNDSHNINTLSFPVFTRLYQATNDDAIPAAVAEVLGISVEEVLERFEGFEPDLTS